MNPSVVVDSLSSQHRPEVVEAALDDCLQELGLEYLDVCCLFGLKDSADHSSYTLFISLLLSPRVLAVWAKIYSHLQGETSPMGTSKLMMESPSSIHGKVSWHHSAARP